MGNDVSDKPESKQISDEITKAVENGRLSCTAAFVIAEKTGVSPAEVGKTADMANIRLSECQLGLFGYSPKKKIIEAREPSPKLRDAIVARSSDQRLSCMSAWEIAAGLNVSKMTVSNACEGMNIRIKPCQLGAF